jgi:hypothetical protein
MNGPQAYQEDTESPAFWDEIWTLDDEWSPIPRQATRRSPAMSPVRPSPAMPVVEALGTLVIER